MKLLRYGPSGREKPGMLDAAGNIRDLSSAIIQIDDRTLAPENWRSCERSSRNRYRWSKAIHVSAFPMLASASSSPWGLITPITPLNRICRFRRSRSCS